MSDKKKFTREVFNIIIKEVVEWNKIGGNEVEDKSLIQTYIQLSREEMYGSNEFLQGWFSGDKVMQADGLGDLIYTVGMLCELTESTEDFILTAEDYKSWDSPKDAIGLLASELITLHDYDNLREFLFALCITMSEFMDVEGVFRSISDSNYSKYVHEDATDLAFIDLDKEVSLIESKGRYGDVKYEKVGNYYVFTAGKDVKSGVVFHKPKIIKSSLFREPVNLEQFIY